MEAFYPTLEAGFDCLISYAILFIEFIGVVVLMVTVIRGVISIFIKKEN